MTLTKEEDRILRGYAKRLHQDLGEEAYHNVVCDTLTRGKAEGIRDIRGFFVVAIKYALYKIFRHEASERRTIESYMNGDPIPQQIGLQRGRLKHEMCRKGLHVLTEENSAYIGVRRTCKACKQARERRKA
jgi:hypothetical protein